MRGFKRLAAAAAVTGLFLGPAAGIASASAATQSGAAASWASASVRPTGGHTSVTTAPGIAAALLGHGIVPIATLPGTEGAQVGGGGIAVRFTFPVTGGTLNLKSLAGTIDHQGGILFASPATGKQIAVGNFVIHARSGVLTAVVNGSPRTRVPLLSVSLAHARIHAARHWVQVSGIVLRLTKTAASALDATFGTTLFTPGLELGTASTLVRF